MSTVLTGALNLCEYLYMCIGEMVYYHVYFGKFSMIYDLCLYQLYLHTYLMCLCTHNNSIIQRCMLNICPSLCNQSLCAYVSFLVKLLHVYKIYSIESIYM